MATTLEYYIIRHKPTGLTLPNAHGRMGRGGSHVEPCDPKFDRPRLFTHKPTAKGFLTTWLKGKVTVRHPTYMEGDEDEVWDIVPVESRKTEEMEIVTIKVRV